MNPVTTSIAANHHLSSIEAFNQNEFEASLHTDQINGVAVKVLNRPQQSTLIPGMKWALKTILVLPLICEVLRAGLSMLSARFGIADGLAKEVNEENRKKLRDMGGEDIYFKLEGGPRLEGMFFEPSIKNIPNPQKTILLCTGSHLSYEKYAVPMVRELLSMGHRVMAFNYSGFGKSEGPASENGVYKSSEAAYQYLIQEKGCTDESIVGWGYSLGSGAVVELADKHAIDIVVDRGFSSMSAVAADVVSPGFKTISKIIFMIGSYFNNMGKINRVTKKVFIAAGNRDWDMKEYGKQLNKVSPQDRTTFREVNSEHLHTDTNIWFDSINRNDRFAIEDFLSGSSLAKNNS